MAAAVYTSGTANRPRSLTAEAAPIPPQHTAVSSTASPVNRSMARPATAPAAAAEAGDRHFAAAISSAAASTPPTRKPENDQP